MFILLKALADVPSCSLCARIYKNEWVQRLFHRVTGATGILLFYNYLPDKRLKFKPNLNKNDCFGVKVKFIWYTHPNYMYTRIIFTKRQLLRGTF